MEEQIKLLHNQGLTIQQIIDKLGVSRQMVSYHTNDKVKADVLTRVEISRAKAKRKRAIEKREIIVKFETLIKAGKNYSQIQKELNLTEWVTRRLKKYVNVEAIKPIKVKDEKIKSMKVKRQKKDQKPETKQTRVFKTKEQNLSQKIGVNLGDRKNTIVYTLPGYSIEKLRAKYLK